MYGNKISVFGLIILFLGLVLYLGWLLGYSGELDKEEDSQLIKYESGNTILYNVGYIFILLGTFFCIIGFTESSEHVQKLQED